MTVFKDKYTGKWVRGYPYMQWPTDKKGHHLMPREMGWFGRKIDHYEYEYIVADSGPMVDTGFATEQMELYGRLETATGEVL